MNPAHIPNAITVARLLMIIPIIWGMVSGHFVLAFWLFLLAGVSDVIDGVLAKRFGWQTEFGAALDPAADKLLFIASFLTLGLLGLIPVWLVALVFARDIIIVLFWATVYLVGVTLTPIPSVPSKVNTVVQTACLALVVLGAAYYVHPALLENMFVLTMLTTVLSGLHYLVIYSRRIRRVAQ